MITQGADVEMHSLKKQGWSLSAIARHVGHDRKTVRDVPERRTRAGVRRRAEVEDPFDRFETYVRQRFADDPHVWATVLFDEVVALGFDRSYQTFTRYVRDRELRPHCEACSGGEGPRACRHRASARSGGPVGLAGTAGDAVGRAGVCVGRRARRTRASSAAGSPSRWTSRISWSGSTRSSRRLGGTPKRWRVDRMATVIVPGTDQVQASFAPVAKHYGVGVDPCPARHGNRKGVVEKNIHFLTQRWWRTARVGSIEAQASLDSFCARVADMRPAR